MVELHPKPISLLLATSATKHEAGENQFPIQSVIDSKCSIRLARGNGIQSCWHELLGQHQVDNIEENDIDQDDEYGSKYSPEDGAQEGGDEAPN